MPKRTTKTRKVTAQRLDAAFQFDMSAISAAIADGKTADFSRIPMLPPSGAVGRDGRGPFTYDIATVVANTKANGADIPIFLDHEFGEAYGWIDHTAEPTLSENGWYEWPVQYTAQGLQMLQAKAYRYNSPTWLYLQNAAITDRQAGEIVGFLENSMTNLPNQYARALNSASTGDYTVQIPDESEQTVTPEQLAALGLAEGATPEAILAAITALKATADAATARVAEIVTAAGAPADAAAPAIVEAAANSRVTAGALVTKQAYDEAVTARDTALAAASTAQNALATYQAAAADAAAVAAVDAAISAGKYVPAAREALCKQARADLVTFNAVTAAMPVHPAAAPRNGVATQGVTDETFGLSAEHLAICKAQEIDPAIFAKTLRASA